MIEEDAKRIEELKILIRKYDIQYYEEGISDISDAEYDRLYDEYLEFEKKYPELKMMEDAPTRRVGAGENAGTTNGLPKFTHKSPLLSIDRKAKELSELKDFYEKVGGNGTEVIVQPKLDGITVNVNYEHGKFANAATRGNGYIGDLITDNFRMTDTKYPKELSDDASIELRGEAIIPYDYFKKKLSSDYSNPRNAVAGIMRQIDAGEVKGKGIQVMFYDFGQVENVLLEDSDSHNVKFLSVLGFQKVPTYVAHTWESLKKIVESGMDGYIQQVDGFNVLMDKNNVYPQAVCDGLVIKVNSRRKREEIGMSEKGPKWAFAYKFKPLHAETRIDHIEWQVGKTGRVVPVAVFDEISLGGTKITRATLNNYGYMQTLPVLEERRHMWAHTDYDNWMIMDDFGKDKPFTRMEYLQEGDVIEDLYPEKSQGKMERIRVKKLDVSMRGFWVEDIENQTSLYDGEWYPFEEGRYCLIPEKGLQMDDIIIVERSNDVIPRIIGIRRHQNIVYQQNEDTSKMIAYRKNTFNKPVVCPDCSANIVEQYPLHFCTNSFCPSRMKGKIEHYASRDAMNIVGLGEGIIDTLFASGYLSDIPSIYNLSEYRTELEKLPKFGKRKVEKLLKSIEETKSPELWQFIYALSIDGVGKKTAKDLAQRYHTLDNFLQASSQDLMKMHDIGETTASDITEYIGSYKHSKMINRLKEAGVNPKPVEIAGDKFAGLIFVITGTLEHPRKYYQDLIEKNGGKVSSSVSKKTSVILVGTDAGSKEEKARKLISEGCPIKILDTEDKVTAFLEV